MEIATSREAEEFLFKFLNKESAEKGIVLGEKFHKLFPWSFKILNSLGICYCIKGNTDKGMEIFQKALRYKMNIEDSEYIIKNLHLLAPAQKFRYSMKVPELLPTPNKDELITFSVTTCKRLHLFKRTINSFIECCREDLWRIGRWLCVDDNSSEEDREEMKKLYPFFEFIFKTPETKGHPQSMNIIRTEGMKTPYLLHMEDDWEFIFKDDCIAKCLEVLNSSSEVKQCTINKNYAPGINDSTDVTGGFPQITQSGTRYFIHEHDSAQNFNLKYLVQDTHIQRCMNIVNNLRNKPDFEFKGEVDRINTPGDLVNYVRSYPTSEFTSKYLAPKNCAFWPHFTLNPNLMKTEVFSTLGPFTTEGHFEKDYGLRYINAGFKTAYLESMRCIHIGWEGKNAYELNECKQFFL